MYSEITIRKGNLIAPVKCLREDLFYEVAIVWLYRAKYVFQRPQKCSVFVTAIFQQTQRSCFNGIKKATLKVGISSKNFVDNFSNFKN